MWNYKAVYIIFKLWDVDMIVLRSTNRTTHFVLQGYNECSLNIMITTPSLFANKGAFSSCVTNDRWCGAIKVIYSFPFFLISSRAVRWSESISCSSWFFSFLSPSFFFFFFKLPLDWTRAPHVRQHLPPDQSGTLGNAWLFQVTGTPLGGLEPTFMEWNSSSWRHLPASQDDQRSCLLPL